MSALLDALEHSACNPEIACVLVGSLVRILQLSPERTIASFKNLNAVSRVLQVACVQAQESRRPGSMEPSNENSGMEALVSVQDQNTCNSPKIIQSCFNCMKMCMEFFAKFIAAAEDTRSLILHSFTCIDCLFDLFWVEGLRDDVLRHILDLMKVFFMCFLLEFCCYNVIGEMIFCVTSFNMAIFLVRLCHSPRKIKKRSCSYALSI